MTITTQDVQHLMDQSPAQPQMQQHEIGRMVRVLNAHRSPTAHTPPAAVATTPVGPLPLMLDHEQDLPAADSFTRQVGQRPADHGRSEQAGVPVRELILRLTQVEDALRAAPTQVGGSGGPTAGILALLARERDIIAELRCPARNREPHRPLTEREPWSAAR